MHFKKGLKYFLNVKLIETLIQTYHFLSIKASREREFLEDNYVYFIYHFKEVWRANSSKNKQNFSTQLDFNSIEKKTST